MNVLEVYEARLGPAELSAAEKSLGTTFWLIVFFSVVFLVALAFVIFYALPEITHKGNLIALTALIPLFISGVVTIYMIRVWQAEKICLAQRRALHFEGVVLGKYIQGKDGLFFRVILGDREVSLRQKYRKEIMIGDHITVVSLHLKNSQRFPDTVLWYREDGSADKGWRSGGGSRISLLESIRAEDPEVLKYLRQKLSMRYEWKQMFRDRQPTNLDEYLAAAKAPK